VALSARGLTVTFPGKPAPVRALDGVDLEIPKGALFVLLGPNGAGKTTLMRCITGLVRPEGGSLSVLGAPASGRPGTSGKAARTGDRHSLARIGVLIENPGVYGRLSVREYLGFFGSFYRMPALGDRIRDLCARFGLETGGRPVSKLSQGNRQKLQLVRSLLHDPDLLLWDEPTDHLDPEAQREVLGYLRSYLESGGATALVATHRLEQMENVASHFGFLRRGRLVRAGARGEILGSADGGGVRVRFAAPPAREALEAAAREAGATVISGVDGAAGPAWDFTVAPPRRAALVSALVAHGLPLELVEPLRVGLPEAYAAVMGGEGGL
jgi:ABC-type multidrug transport system ATPase subunit